MSSRCVIVLLFVSAMFLFEYAEAQDAMTLRVMSFNIRHGEGADGKVDLARIVASIEKANPDLVALLEVDRNTRRSKNIDQAKTLAGRLKMNYVFGKSQNFDGGEFGNAILSRFPITQSKTLMLPPGPSRERSVVVAMIRLGKGKDIRFAATVLGHSGGDGERLPQAEKLNSLFFIEGEESPVILAGSFFATPESKPISELRSKWTDTEDALLQKYTEKTKNKKDFIFFRTKDPFKVQENRIIDTPLLQSNPIISVLTM